MIKIGVIGENKNDVAAVSELLKLKFPNQFYFQQLLPNINGSNLDDKNDNHLVIKLRREFELEELDYLLYIRDLDAPIEDREKVKFRKKRFNRFAKVVDKKAIFMLNIYELEALILADFETYKSHIGNTELVFDSKTAHTIPEPDKKLNEFSNYSKSDVKDIFPKLNFDVLLENHFYFKRFVVEFCKMIENKKYRLAPY